MRTFKQFLEAKFIDAVTTRFKDDARIPKGKTASYYKVPDEHVETLKDHLKRIKELQARIKEIDPRGDLEDDYFKSLRASGPSPHSPGTSSREFDRLMDELQQAFLSYNKFRTSIGAMGPIHGHIRGADAEQLNLHDFV